MFTVYSVRQSGRDKAGEESGGKPRQSLVGCLDFILMADIQQEKCANLLS